MSLSNRLNEDLKQALKAGDELRKGTIRMLISSLNNQRIENRAPLDPQQELSVVQKEAKRRREAAEEYARLGRHDLERTELAELEVLQSYLPQQLADEELQVIVERAVDETGASSQRDMGRVMSLVLAEAQGRADGKRVSQLVRAALTQRADQAGSAGR